MGKPPFKQEGGWSIMIYLGKSISSAESVYPEIIWDLFSICPFLATGGSYAFDLTQQGCASCLLVPLPLCSGWTFLPGRSILVSVSG